MPGPGRRAAYVTLPGGCVRITVPATDRVLACRAVGVHPSPMPFRNCRAATCGESRGRWRTLSTRMMPALVLLTWATTAAAHPLAPSLLRLEEVAPGRVDATWKTPAQRVPGSRLRPILPEMCRPAAKPDVRQEANAYIYAWHLDCGADGLAGATVGAEGMETSMTDVVVYVDLLDGRTFRTILSAARSQWTIPDVESAFEVFSTYVRFGFEHILSGFDHLSFVFALVLLVGVRRVVQVVTAFTLGHSVTLALSALDLVRVEQRPVEILIALSIGIAAWEVVRVAEGRDTGFTRLPALMAATFGLLHGLGFAGALREVGLPQGAIPLSLFSFNVGIELGQIAFVAVVLLPLALLGSTSAMSRRFRVASAYAIGSLAFYWVFERALT